MAHSNNDYINCVKNQNIFNKTFTYNLTDYSFGNLSSSMITLVGFELGTAQIGISVVCHWPLGIQIRMLLLCHLMMLTTTTIGSIKVQLIWFLIK